MTAYYAGIKKRINDNPDNIDYLESSVFSLISILESLPSDSRLISELNEFLNNEIPSLKSSHNQSIYDYTETRVLSILELLINYGAESEKIYLKLIDFQNCLTTYNKFTLQPTPNTIFYFNNVEIIGNRIEGQILKTSGFIGSLSPQNDFYIRYDGANYLINDLFIGNHNELIIELNDSVITLSIPARPLRNIVKQSFKLISKLS